MAAAKNLCEPSTSFQNRWPFWLTKIMFCQSRTVRPVARASGNIGLSGS